MLRVIKEVRPPWVIGENVTGIINMELDTVLSDLEGAGFETQAFIIPACGINAWHRRNRVWILAYNESNRHGSSADKQCGTYRREFQQEEREGCALGDKAQGCSGERVTADTNRDAGRNIKGKVSGKTSPAESEKNQLERLRKHQKQ